MCANFEPAPKATIRLHFGAPEPDFDYSEVWPGGTTPLIVPGEGGLRTIPAMFGLLPAFAKDEQFARRTFNARAETAAEKPSYRQAWARHQLGIVPVQAFFESSWETGRAVRHRIARRDGDPFALACLWTVWRHDGTSRFTLSLLTVNADGHPLMSRFHKPGAEKRSVVVLSGASIGDWLEADQTSTKEMLRPFPDEDFATNVALAARTKVG